MANSEDPYEMLNYTTFHQGLQCLLRHKQFTEKEIKFHSEIITWDPCVYIQWTIPSVLHQTKKKNPLVHKGLK